MKSLFVSLLAVSILIGQATAQKQVSVTPVTGESWLNHLHRKLEETSMGKTVRLGPPTLVPVRVNEGNAAVQNPGPRSVNESVTLHGADVYRLNCRGCHGEFGLGAPPEISSIVDASRATYAPYTMARLNKLGMETSRAQANELANQAKGALLERIHKGGVDMPPFPHLSDAEALAIFGYLRQLADIPGAQQQHASVEESSVRIGEHIVKSTCHTCHNAAGVNPNPDELMQGVIPPLSTLTTRVSLPEFERKVRHGAPILMGTPVLLYRGRMPVFDYLSESEVADAYLYLKLYPPIAGTDTDNPPSQAESASNAVSVASIHEPPQDPPLAASSARTEASETKVPLVFAEAMVAVLVIGGVLFTIYEVKRLKAKTRARTRESLGIARHNIAALPGQSTSRVAHRTRRETPKQAGWHSRFHRSEYHLFEGSWFPRRFENEDGAA